MICHISWQMVRVNNTSPLVMCLLAVTSRYMGYMGLGLANNGICVSLKHSLLMTSLFTSSFLFKSV